MKAECRIAPPNSVLLVVSSENPQIPESLDHDLIAATDTCVAVGTLAEDDGETNVVLTDEPVLESSNLTAVYEGVLENRNGRIAVETVLGEPILSKPCTVVRQPLTIWATERTEPDKIIVQLHS
jgi:hypothetical protein